MNAVELKPLDGDATAMGPDRVPVERLSTPQLHSLVRRAREVMGPRRHRWTPRERDAFEELVERGEPC